MAMIEDKVQAYARHEPLTTPFSQGASAENLWKEYPRPQLERSQWMSLNGRWSYRLEGETELWAAGRLENETSDLLRTPQLRSFSSWDGEIQVPFCIESALSGVEEILRPNQVLWYHRTFRVPRDWQGRRLLLHFEAVDWHAVVWVNNQYAGEHRGGFARFSMDITPLLEDEQQQITVAVWDPSDMGDQAVGKQSLPEHREGFRYTACSGIWQTVWMEPVEPCSIRELCLTPLTDSHEVQLYASIPDKEYAAVLQVTVLDNGHPVATGSGPCNAAFRLAIPQPKLWSPEHPFLYDLQITVLYKGRQTDSIQSYLGMRSIALATDETGHTSLQLNHQAFFGFGPLDQGYWPESLLTPPSEDAILYDLQYLKKIGCNTVRVHAKTHPQRWYYHCDRLGLMVWQDMVCTRKFESKITTVSARQWEQEQQELVRQLCHHPSIITWVLFNEGWGQYDTVRLTDCLRSWDSTRLVNQASGWFDHGGGDFYDVHDYSFYPSTPQQGQLKGRACVLGECGGVDLLLPGHVWNPEQTLQPYCDSRRELVREGYADSATLCQRYTHWAECAQALIPLGCCAVIYTQLSDVEHEPNGWLTYDRRVSKIQVGALQEIHRAFYSPWQQGRGTPLPEFADNRNQWTVQTETAGSVTVPSPIDAAHWPEQATLTVTKTFWLAAIPTRLALEVAGIGDFQISLNGQLFRELKDHSSTQFYTNPLVFTAKIPFKAADFPLLQLGTNTLSILCTPLCKDRHIHVRVLG